MGTVIDLKTKKPIDTNPPPKEPDAIQNGSYFYCTRCGGGKTSGGLFKLASSGRVYCGDCDAQVNNLKVDTTIYLKEKEQGKHGPSAS